MHFKNNNFKVTYKSSMFDYECEHISLISIYYFFGHESSSFFWLERREWNIIGELWRKKRKFHFFLHRKWTQGTYLLLHPHKTLSPNNNSIHNLKCNFFSRIFMQDNILKHSCIHNLCSFFLFTHMLISRFFFLIFRAIQLHQKRTFI